MEISLWFVEAVLVIAGGLLIATIICWLCDSCNNCNKNDWNK